MIGPLRNGQLLSRDIVEWVSRRIQLGDKDQINDFLLNLLALDYVDTLGEFLLCAAARQNKWRCIEYLLGVGFDPQKPDRSGHLPILIAAKQRHEKATETLLSRRPRHDCRRRIVCEPREYPAFASVAELWRQIEGGVSPNSFYGSPPFLIASKFSSDGNWDALSLCIQAGLELEVLTESESNILENIIANDQSDLLFLLRVAGINLWDWRSLLSEKIIHVACRSDSLDVLKLLIEWGFDINEPTDLSRETPLMIAAFSGSVRCCEPLVASGADVNALSAGNKNALHWAAIGGSEVVVPTLLSAGIDMAAITSDGMNAAQIASLVSDHLVAQLYRNFGIVDEYVHPAHVSEWEPVGQFDFMISYRHVSFFDRAAELADRLEREKLRVFLDQIHLQLDPDKATDDSELKSRLLKAVRCSRCVLFFETHDDWLVNAAGGRSERKLNWQVFELLNCARAALVLPEKSRVDLVSQKEPGKRLRAKNLFEFATFEQLAEGIVAHRGELLGAS